MAYIEDRWAKDAARQGSGKRWRVRYRDDRRRWHSKAFTRRAEAEQYLHQVMTDVHAGTYASPERGRRTTVGDMAERWYAAHAPMLKASTAHSYRGVLDNVVLPRWDRVALVDVSFTNCGAWIGELYGGGMSAQRIRHAYGILCQVLDYAVADRTLPVNAIRGVKLPRLPIRQRHRYLTHAELLRLAIAGGQARSLILVLGYCGLRWGEAIALQVRDLDAARGRLQVDRALTEISGTLVPTTPKSHERRSVPVPAIVMDGLPVHADPDALLLPSPAGLPWRNANFRRRVWLPALERADIEPLRIHDLRHTAASLAVQAGAQVPAVARMLGHRDASMTLRVYADLYESDLDSVAFRLDAAARAAEAISGPWPTQVPGNPERRS